MSKLTTLKVKSLKAPGRYSDGGGLYLHIRPTGTKSWVARIGTREKRWDMGLGGVDVVTLAEAREECARLRKLARAGVDPKEERKARRKRVPTFREAALSAHAELSKGWKNPKHSAQWLSTLEAHVFPSLGSRPVDAIEGPAIRDVLAPIWLSVPETARRVRQRIGAVLDWAHAKGLRPDEAPMRSLGKGLPKQPKKDRHFAAMPFADVPAFIAELRGKAESMGRLALEFAILTAARSGEVRGATWREFDLGERKWIVPKDRMKAGVEHIVPLSRRAVEILKRLAEGGSEPDRLVFAGHGTRKPLSDMTLGKVLRDAGKPYTAHGFRSSFRDWAAECSGLPGEVAEAALAHTVRNKVEAAYRRTSFFDARRQLMDAWDSYLAGSGAGNVIPLRSRA